MIPLIRAPRGSTILGSLSLPYLSYPNIVHLLGEYPGLPLELLQLLDGAELPHLEEPGAETISVSLTS